MGYFNKLIFLGIFKIIYVKFLINFLNRIRKVVDINWLGLFSDYRNI